MGVQVPPAAPNLENLKRIMKSESEISLHSLEDEEIKTLQKNLSLTPEQRLLNHQKALNLLKTLQAVPKAQNKESRLIGKTCLVMSLDDLIKSKEAMPRMKDKIVLEELLKIRKMKK